MSHSITLSGRQYVLRKATAADVDVILRQRHDMYIDMGMRDEKALATMAATCRPFLAVQLKEENYHGWLVENDEKEIVAGGGIFLYDCLSTPTDPLIRRPLIMNVYTEPAYRRKGIARALMDAMIAWCREQGFSSVVLHASNDGRPLYESLGFKQTSEMRLRLQ